MNCFQHGNLYRLLSFVPILTLYVIAFVALIWISLAFSAFFLFASVRLFCKFFTCVSNSFILLVLFALLTLFEFLIIVFSSLSFWFSSRSRVLIPLSFSSIISMSALSGVISETSAGVQFAHVYFLFFLIKLY